MSDDKWNPWKLTTIGIGLMMATALVTGLVVASWHANEKPETAERPRVAASAPAAHPAPRQVAATPSSSDVEACKAASSRRS